MDTRTITLYVTAWLPYIYSLKNTKVENIQVQSYSISDTTLQYIHKSLDEIVRSQ